MSNVCVCVREKKRIKRMIPLCFFSKNPNHHKSSSSSSSEMPQNLITCIYQTQFCNSYLTLTWSKSRHSHSLTIHAPDFFSITISLHPNTTFPFNFFFFRARPGSKSVFLTDHGKKLKLFWDFTRAQFNPNSAEPESNFYISITSNSRVEFFLGDLFDDFTRRSSLTSSGPGFGNNSLLSRREHVFGNNNYVSRAEVMGSRHEFAVELCNSNSGGGVLKVKIDGEMKLVVKRLAWKFRGNERIIIGGGVEVEFYWDVFNWVVKKSNNNSVHGNYGVFVFQIGNNNNNNGVWPEMVGAEKKLMLRKSSFLSSSSAGAGRGKIAPAMMMTSSVSSSSPTTTCSSVLQWAEESSDCGRSSCSSTRSSYGIGGGGFSLLLYAWRQD